MERARSRRIGWCRVPSTYSKKNSKLEEKMERKKERTHLTVELAPSIVEIMVCLTEAGAGHSVVHTNCIFMSHGQKWWEMMEEMNVPEFP